MTDDKVIPGRLIHWRMIAQSWVHSRKAMLLLWVIGIASIGLFIGKLEGGQWVDVVKWAVTVYMAANAADGFSDSLKK